MKKLLLSFLAVCSLATAKAQLADGQKALDFTFTALNNNGQIVNLYNWLDSGKYVFLDVSATWCGPCWNYHQTHALDDLYVQHGPGSTSNDVRVVWVEGDGTTDDSKMSGGTGSQGNWLLNTPFPMCNPAQALATSFGNDYNIGYFPTIYMICPDRTIKEVGQLTAAQLYAQVSPTAQCPAKINVDAEAASVVGKLISCNGNYSLDITLKNGGFNNLTSATINAKNGATIVGTQNWNGNLTTYQSINTTLNINGVSNVDSLEIEILATGDQIPANNKFTVFVDNYTSSNASTLPYTENMDGGTKMPAKLGFETYSALSMFGFFDGITGTTKLKGSNGNDTKAVFVNFYNQQAGANAILTLGNYNTNSTSPYLYLNFDVASAAYTAANPENDKLEVLVSTDCGANWTTKWSQSGSTLNTATATNSSFIPTSASQWKNVEVDLTSIKNNPNAIVAIKATSGYGNYSWIDNINMKGSSTPLGIDNINASLIDIYPNPATSDINVRGVNGNATFEFLDVLGRTIKTIELSNISNEVKLSVNDLAKGSYLLKINQEGKSTVKSVVITE